MYRCGRCGSEYTSPLSAAICEDEDFLEDTNTREWFGKFDPHRKD